jgi:RES domain-containing protein
VSEVLAWRLCAALRTPWAFTGEGSARRGGRWNIPGVRLVYCAESRALAALEVLVNADHAPWLSHLTWVCIPAVIPESLIEKPSRFPTSWRDYPHTNESREFGTQWAHAKRSAALRVPSAVVAGEFNYLINPLHPDFEQVKIGKPEAFTFDPRLER